MGEDGRRSPGTSREDGTQQRPCRVAEEEEFPAEEVLEVLRQEGVMQAKEEGRRVSKRKRPQRRSFSPAPPARAVSRQERPASSLGGQRACVEWKRRWAELSDDVSDCRKVA